MPIGHAFMKSVLGDSPGDSILQRIVEGIATEPALSMGYTLASNSGAATALFDKLEGLLGPMLTGMGITTAGELLKVGDGLKKTLVKKGVSPLLVNGFNDFIDEAFEGIWASRRIRGRKRSAPVDKEDVNLGLKHAKESMRQKQIAGKVRFMSALKSVDTAKRSAFLAKAVALTGEDKKKFGYYRPLLIEEMWLVEELSDLPVSQWCARLEAVLGPIQASGAGAVAKTAVHALDEGFKAAERAVDRAIPQHTPGTPSPTLAWIEQARANLKKNRHGI